MTRFLYSPPPLMNDPYADEYTAPFWEKSLREQLSAPRCTNCGTFRMPPHRFCYKCRHQEIEWVDLPGTGHLYSFIIVRQALRPDMSEYVPFIPAVVEADGAPNMRFISNIVDVEPPEVSIDMPLRVAWDHMSDTMVFPRWTLAGI